jgi:S-adenosylmethionine-diacylgycerolhomoserine-N-methlytransferase
MADQTHASHLDGIYRHQRFIYDLTREYYLLGRDRLIAELAPPPAGSILEIGCGTARNLIKAAARYPGTTLYGIDLSSMMLRSAASSVARRGLAHRIRLGFGDATRFDAHELFAIASFDRIFMSYTLSMMPDWQGALHHALRLLAPHGSLHVVDFGACERLPPVFKRGRDAWLRRFSVTPRTALVPELHALARDHACQLNTASPFRGYAIYAVLRRSGSLPRSDTRRR